MQIIYFSDKLSKGRDRLLRTIEAMAPEEVSVHSTVEDLRDKLENRIHEKTLALLVSSTEETLVDLYYLHHLFYKVSSILILPDHVKHTIALGKRMKPNVIFFGDSKERDIVFILERMIGKTRAITAINGRKIPGCIGTIIGITGQFEYEVSNL